MPESKISINVLNTSITIAAGESQEYLDSLLETYRKEIDEIQKTTGLDDALKTAVLTGFFLCDKVEKLKAEKKGMDIRQQEKDTEFREAESLTLTLISRLDEVLDRDNRIVSDSPAVSGDAAEVDVKPSFYKLTNVIKNYPWGSPDWIPALLGAENPLRSPWAELWMGVHPEGPSSLTNEKGEQVLLSALINEDPSYFLGEETEKEFGALPFLFKVLAADKPLSIQVHPNLIQAREGWERENREGIGLNAPERNYKDPNHKPEIICALGPFRALCGFREPGEIITLIEIFSHNAPAPLRDGLGLLVSALKSRSGDPLMSFVRALFGMERDVRMSLSFFALSGKGGAETPAEALSDRDAAPGYPQYSEEWKLVSRLAQLYPGDPAMLAPLYLNLIELNAGEAIYLPAGILHAYVEGLGVELMADSDNVLRGGLTLKHIDQKELFRVLDFAPYKPELLKAPSPTGSKGSFFTYPASCRDFSLSFLSGKTRYTASGPGIIIVNSGELSISSSKKPFILCKGESAFIPSGEAMRGLEFSGIYTAYAASTNLPSSQTADAVSPSP